MSKRFDEEPDEQQEMVDAIKASPIIAYCECGNEIRQGEIDCGVANISECMQCVRDEVLYF